MFKRLATEFGLATAGSAAALALLWFLHGTWSWPWAAGCGFAGAVGLRLLVRSTYEGFPLFLRAPLDASVAILGVEITVWATMVRYPFTYWVLKAGEVATMAVAAALLGLGVAGVVYTHRRLARVIEERESRLAELRQAELEARLRALQAQIQPHFLFNALNSLAELVHGDPDEAEQFVGDLAHLLRYSLRTSADSLVPLHQEIEVVERYLRIERARLGPRLRTEIQVDPAARERLIPGLTVQPLVENAVRHAIAPRTDGGTVAVHAHLDRNDLVVVVHDDGPGLPDDVAARLRRDGTFLPARVGGDATSAPAVGSGGAGGGLANVHQRIALTCGAAGSLTLAPPDPDDPGTELILTLPRDLEDRR